MKFIEQNGRWVEVRPRQATGQTIMRDIKPYKSMLDGSIINSRSTHRDHLRSHECIEVGNEKLKPNVVGDVNPKGRLETIVRQFRDMSDKEFRQVMKRSVKQ
jgi:hypothetical protein